MTILTQMTLVEKQNGNQTLNLIVKENNTFCATLINSTTCLTCLKCYIKTWIHFTEMSKCAPPPWTIVNTITKQNEN